MKSKVYSCVKCRRITSTTNEEVLKNAICFKCRKEIKNDEKMPNMPETNSETIQQ